MKDELFDKISEIVADFVACAKEGKVKKRNRGDAVFQSTHPKVKDNGDHFPINDRDQALAAWRYVNKDQNHPWWGGTKEELVNAVKRKINSKFPGVIKKDKD